MARIVITEFMDEHAVGVLSQSHDVSYDPTLHADRERLVAQVGDAAALIVRNQTVVDTELLDAGPSLAVIGRLGVGLDNIDVDACEARGVAVRVAAGANGDAVAEYVIAATLMLLRGAFLSSGLVAAGEWPREQSSGLEVRGRTIGLVGFGAIAQLVASRARSLGMRVVATDPYLPADHPDWDRADNASMEVVLAEADAVSIHVPLTEDTRDLIGEAEIAQMKDTAVLINTSRGGIVDEDAVCEALRSGALRGAALDVFANEPVTAESGARFADVPNLILTPHIAGITAESSRRVGDAVAAGVSSVLRGQGR